MPSTLHEAERLLVRQQPETVLELLRQQRRVTLPAYSGVQIYDTDLTELVPPEARADAVFRLLDGDAVVMGLIVEIQRAIDVQKRYQWPLYASALHGQLKTQIGLVVLATTSEVDRWARRPIDTVQLGSVFWPIVFGPADIPRIEDPEGAKRAPAMAILSALTHGNAAGGVPILLAAFQGLSAIPPELREDYGRLLMVSLTEATIEALEAFVKSHPELLEQELAESPFGKYLERVRAEGEAKGEARALLALLSERNLQASEPQRQKILSCKEPELLMRWIRRAAKAVSVDDVLSDT